MRVNFKRYKELTTLAPEPIYTSVYNGSCFMVFVLNS